MCGPYECSGSLREISNILCEGCAWFQLVGDGCALLEGVRGFNWWVMGKAAFGWVFTCVFVGVVAGLMSAVGAYAPSARYPDVVWVNGSS